MILVDAYNILHAPRALSRFQGDIGIEDLAGAVAVSRFRRRRAVLICDGGPPPGGLGTSAQPLAEFRFRIEGVEILYAGPGRDADSLIEALIELESGPSRLIVASSDRRLVRAAKRSKARSMSADDFVRIIFDDAERAARAWRRPAFSAQVPLTPEQVRYWSRLMGVHPETDADAAASPTPTAPSQEPAARPRPRPSRAAPSRDAGGVPSVPPEAPFSAPFALDPLLREALEEWRGRLTLDDLDMQRWIGNDASRPPD